MLQSVFDKIITLILDLQRYMSADMTAVESVLPAKRRELNVLLNKLMQYKSQISPEFVTKNQALMFKVHEVLVGTLAKLHLNKEQIGDNRSLHDKFFKTVFGIKNAKAHFARLPTRITTEFCKGIAYFESDTGLNKVPFYHRDASCGSEEQTAEQKFLQSKDTKKTQYLRNCYIERYSPANLK